MEMVLLDLVNVEPIGIAKLVLAAIFTFAATCKVATKCK